MKVCLESFCQKNEWGSQNVPRGRSTLRQEKATSGILWAYSVLYWLFLKKILFLGCTRKRRDIKESKKTQNYPISSSWSMSEPHWCKTLVPMQRLLNWSQNKRCYIVYSSRDILLFSPSTAAVRNTKVRWNFTSNWPTWMCTIVAFPIYKTIVKSFIE